MKGTVLGSGVILSADEQRYSYIDDDVKSVTANGTTVVLRQGDEVDFIVDGQNAKEIYLTKAKSLNINFDNMNFDLKSNDLSTIRTLGLAGSALPILGVIPFLGIVFVIAGFICILLAIFKLSNKIGSPTLKKNYVLYLVATLAASILIFLGMTMGVFAFMNAGIGYSGAGGASMIIGAILGVAGLAGVIYGFFKEFQVYNELSNISGDKFFLYYFIGTVVGLLTTVIIIGYVILLVAFIIQIIAWYRLQEVKTA
jgi:hypothetical protein